MFRCTPKYAYLLSLLLMLLPVDMKGIQSKSPVVSKFTIRQGIPISEQFACANCTYEIKNSFEIGWNTDEAECKNVVSVERLVGKLNCNQTVVIEKETYYCQEGPIKLYWNESVAIPSGCVVISKDKKSIHSRNESYCPGGSGADVFIGCKSNKVVDYKHCKGFTPQQKL